MGKQTVLGLITSKLETTWKLTLTVNGFHKHPAGDVAVLVLHLSNTFSLLSQRDAQGPFIHRETAEHERCRGSSCATGVPCDGGSLSADLLEEGE